MNNDFPPAPLDPQLNSGDRQPENRNSSEKSDFDPHAPGLNARDWKIIAYFAGLGIVPLLAILVVIFILVTRYPNFDNFQKAPKTQQMIESETDVGKY